jgi:vacuolar protein sorting-associated protein IST1
VNSALQVENVIREDFIIEAYEILELFCELLLARLGVINISKYVGFTRELSRAILIFSFRECPADIKEAVCTVIYAAPRADIKELSVVSAIQNHSVTFS